MQVPPRETVREAARRILSSSDYRYDEDRKESRVLQKLWNKLVEWFEALGTLHETAPILYWVLLITCCVLLIGIIVHVILVLRRVAGRGPEQRSERRRKERAKEPAELLEDARRFARDGAFAAALTCYLRAAITGLDRRQVLRFSETATVREYVAMLRKRPAEQKDFSLLLACYEPAVFGRRDPAPDAMKACDAAVEAMIRAH